MRRFAVLVTGILALAAASPALAHDDAPYIGVWDCGVGVFTFTAESYSPGDAPMQIKSIEGSDGTYTMTFDDGYQIGVSMNGNDAMGWLSMASGDSFDCTRLYY
jgi:hypothetical protein